MNPSQWRRATVLAVDDQRANLVALDAVLSSEFDVILAGSAFEALSILESREDVDVILMDAQMPGMDGFEAASRIKAREGCRDIPIVFITAVYNEDPFVKRGYKVGAVDYFSKPFDPEILKLKVGIYASFRQKAAMLKEWTRQIHESEELLRAGRRLSALLESGEVGVMVADSEGRLSITSPECRDLWPDFSLSACGHEHERRIAARSADGAPRSILCRVSPLRALDGTACGAVVVMHDVTEREELARELELRIDRMLSADADLQAR